MNPRPLWAADVTPIFAQPPLCFFKRASLSSLWSAAYQCPPGYLLNARSCSLQWPHMYFPCSLMSSHKMENSSQPSWMGCQKTNGCCCLDASAAVSTGPWGVWMPEHCSKAVRTLSNCHCCGRTATWSPSCAVPLPGTLKVPREVASHSLSPWSLALVLPSLLN